jgi:hypothetical protein
MPDVSVQLQPVGQSEAYEVQTGNNGRFQFRNVPNGDYTLAAVRSGFVRADYGRHRTSDAPLYLAVGVNGTIRGIEIHMISSSAIFGRVTDEEGEPVAAAIVRAWQETFVEGQRALRMVTTVSTDDLGNYRLYSLSPGNYYVSAGGNLPSFYPNTTDLRTARRVTVAEGSMTGGVNITERSETRREIRGTVSSPYPEASVQLIPRIPVLSEGTLGASVDSRTGQFSIPEVSPGSYILTATSGQVSVHTSIEVGNARVLDVRIAIPSPVEIRARVSLDPKTVSNIDISNVVTNLVFALSWDSDVPNLPYVTYAPLNDNAFTIRLAPGDYRMRTEFIPPGLYVQSIRIGNNDVLNVGLHVESSVQTPLEIVVAADIGSLEGVVRNVEKHAEPNVEVALVPAESRRRRTDLYQSVRTDAEGHFQFEHVPPGDYTVYSWEDVEPTAWMNSNFMKDYEGRGKPVHIEAGARQTIQVEAIP